MVNGERQWPLATNEMRLLSERFFGTKYFDESPRTAHGPTQFIYQNAKAKANVTIELICSIKSDIPQSEQ